ncbi:MAG: hypothetical protein ABIT38_03330 [Gemmatimonadaceae bacterium]
MSRSRTLALALAAAFTAACHPPARTAAPTSPTPASASGTRGPSPPRAGGASDTSANLIPVGYGSLRQDDIALRMTQFGLQVRALPLDESVIRVLSPDSYRTLRELIASQRDRLDEIRRRNGLSSLSLWYISFFGVEQGETRFSPMEVIVANVGRNFRPVDVIPLSPSFGLQRLRQREAQHGLYVFDGQVDVNQPLVISYETVSNSDWPTILQRIERERALVRSRMRDRR